MDIPGMDMIHFVCKPLKLDLNWIYFGLSLPNKLFKSSVYFDLRWGIKDSWAHWNFKSDMYLKGALAHGLFQIP